MLQLCVWFKRKKKKQYENNKRVKWIACTTGQFHRKFRFLVIHNQKRMYTRIICSQIDERHCPPAGQLILQFKIFAHRQRAFRYTHTKRLLLRNCWESKKSPIALSVMIKWNPEKQSFFSEETQRKNKCPRKWLLHSTEFTIDLQISVRIVSLAFPYEIDRPHMNGWI